MMNMLKRTRYGLMIFNKKDIWVGRSFDLYGEYSESEVQVFKETIKSGDVVLDIGANIGSHTIAFARLCFPGMVAAFEPERNAYYALCGNVSLNNLHNIRCYQQAIGNQNRSIMVPELDFERTNNWGGLSLDVNCQHGYQVNLLKMDDLGLNRLDFVKIDVEGMEKEVLEGGINVIKDKKPVLYVENDRAEKSTELIAFIKELGYEIYSHSAPLYNPNNFFENKENVFLENNNHFISINLYCHHKDKPCLINPQSFAMSKVL